MENNLQTSSDLLIENIFFAQKSKTLSKYVYKLNK